MRTQGLSANIQSTSGPYLYSIPVPPCEEFTPKGLQIGKNAPEGRVAGGRADGPGVPTLKFVVEARWACS